MIVYVLLLIFIIVGRVVLTKNKIAISTLNNKVVIKNLGVLSYCIGVGTFLYLLVALRSIYLGVYDTANTYYISFNIANLRSWSYAVDNFKQMGHIFALITKILTIFTGTNYRLYLILVSIPYIYSVCYMVYKYSDEYLLSFMAFISMFYLYSFYLIRQMIAVSILCISLKYIYEKKLIKFIILVLCASLIHGTAFCFLIAYPAAHYIKADGKNYLIVLISVIIAKITPGIVYFFMSNRLRGYVENGVYDINGNISIFPMLIYIAILLFASYSKVNQDYEGKILFNIVTLAAAIYPFANVISDIYRLTIYFGIFSILLVSKAIANIKNPKTKIALYTLIFSLYVLYFFTRSLINMNAIPYEFFWNAGFI